MEYHPLFPMLRSLIVKTTPHNRQDITSLVPTAHQKLVHPLLLSAVFAIAIIVSLLQELLDLAPLIRAVLLLKRLLDGVASDTFLHQIHTKALSALLLLSQADILPCIAQIIHVMITLEIVGRLLDTLLGITSSL